MNYQISHCPICHVCRKPITNRGILLHGNINVIDQNKPDGDGGGIIGSNFLPMNTEVSLYDLVKKVPYHVDCFAGEVDKGIDLLGEKA